jgi:hypothetical protein
VLSPESTKFKGQLGNKDDIGYNTVLRPTTIHIQKKFESLNPTTTNNKSIPQYRLQTPLDDQMGRESHKKHSHDGATVIQAKVILVESDTASNDNQNRNQLASCLRLELPIEAGGQTSTRLTDARKPDERQPRQTNTSAEEGSATGAESWDKSLGCSWLEPHIAEHQKHTWHAKSLGMTSLTVTDEWGFHSTSASRSQSPNNKKSE